MSKRRSEEIFWFLFLLIWLVALAFGFIPAEAQVTKSAYGVGGVSVAPGLGFRPGFTAGIGGAVSGEKYALTGEATFDTADKIHTNDGTAARLEIIGYRFVGKAWGFGGGGACSGYVTSAYGKGSCRPIAASLWAPAKGLGFGMDYLFVGSDRENRLQGPRFMVLATLTDKVRFDYRLGIYTFVSGARYTAAKSEVRLRYYF